VQKRLTEITVAPATVKLAPKVDASIATMPKTAAGLTPGIYKYQAKISVAGQEIPIKLSTMIKEEGGTYIATDTMETPMGQVSDEASLDKATLEVKKRSVRQGPMAIDVAYADGKASGKMAMNGQDRPIDAATGGALFADSAAAQFSIGALPLADGYKVEQSSADGGPEKATIFIDKASRKSVKTTSIMPAMNGETMVMELLP